MSSDPLPPSVAATLTRLGTVTGSGPHASIHPQLDGAPEPSLPMLGSGARLVEGEVLGEGGMGVVVAATDPVLDRTVAVKRARSGAPAHAAWAIVAEARVVARLDHPNVVPVHALGTDAEGRPSVVMKRIGGRPWSELSDLDEERHLEIALEVCDALRFAHDRGTLHLDVKPQNVMVGAFGEVYLMDWGCARPATGATTRQVTGTPSAMAPEMVEHGAPLGPRTDVYLVGATLHRVLTGQPRHPGTDVRDVLARAWHSEPATYGPELAPELGAVLNRACARAPEDRYGSIAELAEALRTYRSHREAAGLAREAARQLDEVAALVERRDPRADALFADVRAGLRAALRAWPDCGEAEVALARARDLFVGHRLETGDLAGAEALLDEADPATREKWGEPVRAARRRHEASRAVVAAHDLTVASRERRTVFVALALCAVVLACGAAFLFGGFGHQFDIEQIVALGAVELALVAGAIVPFRRALFRTRVSGAIVTGAVVMSTGWFVQRMTAWVAGTPVPDLLRMLAFDCAMATVLLALIGERALALAAVPSLASGLAIVLWPAHASQLYPMGVVGTVVIGGAVFARRVRA